MHPLTQQGSNRYSLDAKTVRDEFCDYFNSVGSEEWQWGGDLIKIDIPKANWKLFFWSNNIPQEQQLFVPCPFWSINLVQTCPTFDWFITFGFLLGVPFLFDRFLCNKRPDLRFFFMKKIRSVLYNIMDLDITIENGSLITKIYDKRDDFDFPIVNFPFLDGDIPLAPSYGIYISQLVRFCRICTKVSDFNERNLHLTEKLLKQGYRYHKLLKTFTKFFHRYNVLVHKFGATCRSLIRNGISHPRFYGNIRIIVYNSYKFNKNRILDMSDSLNKFIHKGYKYEIIINTLKLVFRKKDIKLLIPLLNKN